MAKAAGQKVVKKKKKKRAVKELNQGDEYGIEDEYDQEEEAKADNEEEDAQLAKDRKICAKSPEFKRVWDLCEQLKAKFP